MPSSSSGKHSGFGFMRIVLTSIAALLLPGAAFAQSAKEQELEARIAQLESQVQALIGAQQQQQATASRNAVLNGSMSSVECSPCRVQPSRELR